MSLCYATVLVFPYLATQRSFAPGDVVPGHFPIAIIHLGRPTTVRWSAYQKNPAALASALVRAPVDERFPLNDLEFLTLKSSSNDILALTLHTDDYVFWARYAIEHDRVRPVSLRFSGPFVALYALVVGAVGTALVSVWWRRARRLRPPA